MDGQQPSGYTKSTYMGMDNQFNPATVKPDSTPINPDVIDPTNPQVVTPEEFINSVVPVNINEPSDRDIFI